MPSSALIAALTTLALASAGGDDWPHLRGPNLDGRASGLELPAEGPVSFRPVWTTPLGPSYSGVAVAAGRAVTHLSDGAVNAVVALDTKDGSEVWRHELGPIYLGHDGSEDGPISSPVIGAGAAFALGPRGTLVALELADGSVRWSTALVEDLGATQPEYGFSTTPLLEDDLLIVQAGGSEGRLLCALDAASGELRWSVGDGEAGYSSPMLMDLAGRRQVVVLNGLELLGVAPESGELLWSFPLGEDNAAGSGMAVPIDEGRFCANLGGGLTIFSVSAMETGVVVEELARSRDMGRSYAAPVLVDGYLYGFKSDFLTCVDAATGKRAWRSRPPGGRGLIAVDEHLIVFGAQGVVALVEASPEAYVERARVEALAHTSYTWPSFAEGRLFVRNNEQLACLELVQAGAPTPVAAVGGPGDGGEPVAAAFEALLDALVLFEGTDERQAAVDDFVAEQEQLPLVDGELVTFVYQGDCEDVALVGSMVDGSKADPLERLEGTNLFHRTYRIAPGARWEYRFQVDYDQWETDPGNPRTSPADWGPAPVSELVLAGYVEPEHIAEPVGALRGRIEPMELASERLGDTRTLEVYLPAGYDEGEETYPLLLVHQGPDWQAKGLLPNTLDNLIGSRLRPLVVVFIPPTRAWWHEAGGTGTEEYIAMLATELVPALEATYRLSPEPAGRAVMGASSFGITAVYATLLYPEVFGKAAAQSLRLDDVARHELFRQIETKPRHDTTYYLDWCRYEDRDQDAGYDLREHGQRVWKALAAAGYPLTGGEANDAYGWGGWRARSDELLVALFPIEPGDD